MKLSDLRTRTLRRLGEDPAAPSAYLPAKVDQAINRAQRLFAFGTLCLESTREFVLTPGTAFYHILPQWQDFLAVLRVRRSTLEDTGLDADLTDPITGPPTFNSTSSAPALVSDSKIYPVSLSQLRDLDALWMETTGAPLRYGVLGQDLMYFYRTPDVAYELAITLARLPAVLVDDTDEPDILPADHQALVHGATVFCRLKEGGQELAKAMRDDAAIYFEAINTRARATRARGQAQRYDTLPAELDRFDISQKPELRNDLPPRGKRPPWATAG